MMSAINPDCALLHRHHLHSSAIITLPFGCSIQLDEWKETDHRHCQTCPHKKSTSNNLLDFKFSISNRWLNSEKKGHWPLPLPHEECRERMLPFTHKIVETDPYSVDLVIRAQQCLGSHQMYRYYNESHFVTWVSTFRMHRVESPPTNSKTLTPNPWEDR